MAKKGAEGTRVPREGKAFHIPADIRPLGNAANPIIQAMRREHYALGRHLAPKRKDK